VRDYKHGVWVGDFGSVLDSYLVVRSLAAVLQIREALGRQLVETLVSSLRSKHMLVVLDNCEHVLDACASVAETLSRNCRDVRLLATSRQSLGVVGEHVYHVPSLSTPEPPYRLALDEIAQYEAVRLFVERVTALQSDFSITERNAAAVADVCWRLDGIPLALELAAARVPLVGLEHLATHLDHRLGLLGGRRRGPPRQQTLRATLDWSYALLTATERLVFDRAAVFVGSWSLDAAQSICSGNGVDANDVLELLGQILDKSLLVVQSMSDGPPRFSMLQIVREYASAQLEKSGNSELRRRHHAMYYLAQVETAEDALWGLRQGASLRRLDTEHDNLRAALRFFLQSGTAGQQHDAVNGLRLAGALWRFWAERGHLVEGRRSIEALLTLQPTPRISEIRAKALFGLGHIALRQGDLMAARSAHEEAPRIRRELGDLPAVANSLHHLGWAVHYARDFAEARLLYEESLSLYRRTGRHRGDARKMGFGQPAPGLPGVDLAHRRHRHRRGPPGR
jgi:non-specific serine/threonine protein kinase